MAVSGLAIRQVVKIADYRPPQKIDPPREQADVRDKNLLFMARRRSGSSR